MSDEGFLARWSRRKAGIAAPADERGDAAPAAPLPGATAPPPSPALPEGTGVEPAAAAEAAGTAPPLPTLADVAALTRESDYARFMAPGVDRSVRNAAMKKLFSDPRFNVMDGLDVYIDDYSKPDPLPEGWLEKLNQYAALNSHNEPEREAEASKAPAIPASPPPTESAASPPIPVPEPPAGGPPSDTSATPDLAPDAVNRAPD